ncbi:hypothetical protein C499_17904 [Halogeometricum borinquense DSM 11551]|uniref:Uncharacterized protein n=1 Tax=Halogeometricum borinquense (strain ATCC 700274 / DSM 11551 / JCM 10706 / KCTC 4070 / PR3) TaxID=469382 RepID=E4NPJ9_HALBP|nr:hypothetical protein [Halogeometricum borinquense]ADQ67669.1 hypothetical protein Hbor_21050 [Halogeometricum borinquense DSM 11551]ELY23650.1 hypothetical protein C499_17904 [Halogeometricum borinquense DSM 11551]
MSRRRDAIATLAVLIPTLATVVVCNSPVTPFAVGAGAAGALAIEALLSLRATRVRREWERPAVQLASVAVGLVVAAVGVAVLGPLAATVLAAGLCTYLGFLVALTLLGR